VVTTYSRELEIVVYCACPNEESAAVAAKHLKQAVKPFTAEEMAWFDSASRVF
jgi:hypothetical protein